VESVQRDFGWSGSRSRRVVEYLIEIIKKTLASGDDLLISGFGKFCVKEKKGRRGRNPADAQPMVLPKRKVVVFKCSGILRNRMNP
jgi:integration host factor subunit alpha